MWHALWQLPGDCSVRIQSNASKHYSAWGVVAFKGVLISELGHQSLVCRLIACQRWSDDCFGACFGLAVGHQSGSEVEVITFYSRTRPFDDVPVFAVVLPKSRDGRHHDRSGAEPRFVDCNRGERSDLGLASTRPLRHCSRNCRQRRSFRLGERRGLARCQSVAALSRGSRVGLWAHHDAMMDSGILIRRRKGRANLHRGPAISCLPVSLVSRGTT